MAEGLRRNLKLGADPIEFELVYWADLVYPAPLDPDPAPYTPAEGAGELPRHEDSFLGRVKHLAKEAVGGLLDKGTALPGVDEAAEEVIARKATDLQRYYEDPAKRRAIRQQLESTCDAAADFPASLAAGCKSLRVWRNIRQRSGSGEPAPEFEYVQTVNW